MKKLILLGIILVTCSGCATIDKYNTQENRKKLKELIEKYNTPENREKLYEAIDKYYKERD